MAKGKKRYKRQQPTAKRKNLKTQTGLDEIVKTPQPSTSKNVENDALIADSATTPEASSSNSNSPFHGFGPAAQQAPEKDEDRENTFEQLLEPKLRSSFPHKNVKTYARDRSKDKLLSFQNDHNREQIIQWLTDNRNLFDKHTMTQEPLNDTAESDDFDVPAVVEVKRTARAVRKGRRARSPYQLRARSLDITVKKNVRRGRSRNHTVSGESPEQGNYEIVEILSVKGPASADNKMIIDLLEDEYLDCLDREIEPAVKKPQSGWDRIKDFNQTITKQQLRQLDITLQNTQEKKRNSPDCSKIFDLDPLERYFVSQMGHILKGESCESPEQTHLDKAREIGENFLQILTELQHDSLMELSSIILKIGSFCKTISVNASTQTTSVGNVMGVAETSKDQRTQTLVIENKNQHTQTTVLVEKTDKTKAMTVGAQTEDLNNNFNKSVQVSLSGSKKSLVFAQENKDSCVEIIRDEPSQVQNKSILNNTLDELCFETEDVLMDAELVEQVEVAEKASQRVKRQLGDNSRELSQAKRPCAKFINEDISIAFDSEQNFCSVVSEPALARTDVVGSHTDAPPQQSLCQQRTQDEIAMYENMILDALKPDEHLIEKPPEAPIKEPEELDMDYFEPHPIAFQSGSSTGAYKSSLISKVERQITNKFSESLFAGQDSMLDNQTVVQIHHVDEAVERTETTIKKCKNTDEMLADIEIKPKINILQNIRIEPVELDVDSDATLDDLDADIVAATPDENPRSIWDRKELSLNVTLPPPDEFQDFESIKQASPPTSPSRRPLCEINKITSTPNTGKEHLESMSLSPISMTGSARRRLTYLDIIQKSKFSPLQITKRSPSQRSIRHDNTKQRSILTYIKSQESVLSNSTSMLTSQDRKPCIAGTRLSKDQMMLIASLTNKKLATFSSSFIPTVTHLIVATDSNNQLMDHTMKFVTAVASGIWVLNVNWIRECLANNCLVPEGPFEVLDVSGLSGPKHSRLMRLSQPLLRQFKIYAAPPFVSTSKQEVETVVQLLGGKVVGTPDELLYKDGCICLIVTEARATQDVDLYEEWLQALEVVTVDIEWLSRSVGQYKLQNLPPFTLCTDTLMHKLGYPKSLIHYSPTSTFEDRSVPSTR